MHVRYANFFPIFIFYFLRYQDDSIEKHGNSVYLSSITDAAFKLELCELSNAHNISKTESASREKDGLLQYMRDRYVGQPVAFETTTTYLKDVDSGRIPQTASVLQRIN